MRYNHIMIVGIDEVGRGPWAGPLVIGAVALGDAIIEGLADSKQLTKKRREEVYGEILAKSAAWGIGWVDANEIDEIGLSASLTLATKRALEAIHVPYHQIIIDGTINFLKGTKKGEYVTTMKKADDLIASVSAASIIAKVARDDYMDEQSKRFPQFGFESNVGYGTAKHQKALLQHGVTPLHRRSFAPVAAVLGTAQVDTRGVQKHTRKIGNESESAAAKWLEEQGYRVESRNWKTKFCEIDIVASKDEYVYFVEVKHRREGTSGDGLAAITARKLRQMTFAAELYRTSHRSGLSPRLAAIATSGETPRVDTIVTID